LGLLQNPAEKLG